MTAPRTILVTGGTGKTGRRVAEGLEQHAVPHRVASRSTRPRLDFDDPATWDDALDGVDAAYLVYAPDLAFPDAADTLGRFTRHAADRGVTRAVVLSGRGEPGTHAAEQAVRDAIPDSTVLRCSWFAQNLSEHFLLEAVLDGVIALPGRDVGEPFIDVRDIAEVAVQALTTDAHRGQTLELTGPRLVAFSEVADLLTGRLGRPIHYVTVSTEQYRDHAVAAGLDPAEATALADLFSFVLDGHNATTTDTVERVLGRPPRDIADYIDETAVTGVWSTPAEVVR